MLSDLAYAHPALHPALCAGSRRGEQGRAGEGTRESKGRKAVDREMWGGGEEEAGREERSVVFPLMNQFMKEEGVGGRPGAIRQ